MTALPPGSCGLAFRREHADDVLAGGHGVPFFELITESCMGEGGRPTFFLDRIARDTPVALHGVSLSVGSAEPPSRTYLRKLKELVRRVEPAVVSDHLCFSSLGGRSSHALLPLPFTEEAVRVVARKVRLVQDLLGRRILLENVSSYLRHAVAELTEPEFVSAVLEEADCGLLLDVNNLYVNCRNHGLSPFEYLDAIPPSRVELIHLAGHEDHGDFVVDTHDRDVAEPVWWIYRLALRRFGPVPSVLERDGRIPPFERLAREARRAEAIARREAAGGCVGRAALGGAVPGGVDEMWF